MTALLSHALVGIASATGGFFLACWICSTHQKEAERQRKEADRLRKDYTP